MYCWSYNQCGWAHQQSTYAQLSPLYLLSTLYVTRVTNYSKLPPAFLYYMYSLRVASHPIALLQECCVTFHDRTSFLLHLPRSRSRRKAHGGCFPLMSLYFHTINAQQSYVHITNFPTGLDVMQSHFSYYQPCRVTRRWKAPSRSKTNNSSGGWHHGRKNKWHLYATILLPWATLHCLVTFSTSVKGGAYLMYQILIHSMKRILNGGPVILHFEHDVIKMYFVCALFRVLQ